MTFGRFDDDQAQGKSKYNDLAPVTRSTVRTIGRPFETNLKGQQYVTKRAAQNILMREVDAWVLRFNVIHKMFEAIKKGNHRNVKTTVM
ncbi:hypothetical protein CVT26_003738 [Gymnopilus dilepis]|uniref:Uncharacterized protein n=1 Tax=Gymnopilus dilepis TaxID=231916 RepID=A0A409YXE3_9AGAR|nr:hypothetical protein CVT26_003738 [Gymnopilus dilepis]